MSDSNSIRNQRPTMVRIDTEPIRSPKNKAGCVQTAAGVAADCTAVCCCCPFALINLFLFCFIKVPVGITVRSVRWAKRKAHKCRESCSCKSRGAALLYSFEDDDEKDFEWMEKEGKGANEKDLVFLFDCGKTKEETELEKEMMMNLSGFGRSLSQRHEYLALQRDD